MPAFVWPIDSAPIVSGLGDDAGGYLSWAMWAVDALHYLDDLDQHGERLRWTRVGHHADTVDLAHVRWAASTAMTALDLSAAAVGAHDGVPCRQTVRTMSRTSTRTERRFATAASPGWTVS